MNSQKLAIILCRISDEKQKDGYSLSAQKKYALEYCSFNNFKVVETYSFVETASKVDKRFKFKDMYKSLVELMKKQKTNDPIILVVEKPDRLSRNLSDKEMLDAHVIRGHLEIHYYKESKILTSKSSPADFFSNDVMTSLNKYMASNNGKETMKGMMQKAEEGLYPGKAPIGYINLREGVVGKQKRKPSVIKKDPLTCKAVYRIFELRALHSKSLEAIREQLIEECLLPAKKIRTLNKGSIQKTLMNPFYGGYFNFRGKEYKGSHELFIPNDWLIKVQGITRYGGKRKPIGIFSGFFICGNSDCACTIIYDPKVKKIKATNEIRKYDYYHCTDGRGIHKAENKKQVNVTETHLWKELERPVRDINISEEFANIVAKAINESYQRSLSSLKDTVEKYLNDLVALERDEDESTDALLEKKIDQEVYNRRISKIKNARRVTDRLLEDARGKGNDKFQVNSQKILELAKNAELLWNTRNAEEKRAFLEKVLSNQELDGITIKYCLKKPFDVLLKMKDLNEKEKWCPRRDLPRAI